MPRIRLGWGSGAGEERMPSRDYGEEQRTETFCPQGLGFTLLPSLFVDMTLPPACEFIQSTLCQRQLWTHQDRHGVDDRRCLANKGLP